MAFRQLQNGPSVAHGKRVLRLDRYRILLTTAYTATEERTGIYGQWPLQRSANTACVLIVIARAGYLRPLFVPSAPLASGRKNGAECYDAYVITWARCRAKQRNGAPIRDTL